MLDEGFEPSTPKTVVLSHLRLPFSPIQPSAGNRTCTCTSVWTQGFEPCVSAIPPHRPTYYLVRARGFAPPCPLRAAGSKPAASAVSPRSHSGAGGNRTHVTDLYGANTLVSRTSQPQKLSGDREIRTPNSCVQSRSVPIITTSPCGGF